MSHLISRLFPAMAVAALTALSVRGASAAVDAPIFTYNSTIGGSVRNDGPYTEGNLMQVGASSLTLTALGVQDVGANGLTVDTPVGIWTADGSQLLRSVTVTSADTIFGGYRYVILTQPLVLAANTQFLIGTLVGGGREAFIDNVNASPFSADSGFTILENRYATDIFTAPVLNGTGTIGRWGPANAQFRATVVPEANTFALALPALGMVGAVVIRRRKK